MTDTSRAPIVLAHQDALWVLSKPAGWHTHAAGDGAPDVVSWARSELAGAQTAAPCHRLDRETSGLLLLASSPEVRAAVGAWLAEGTLEKRYLALVHGRTHRKGVIRRALADARRGRPLPAVTRFRRLEWLGPTTLVQARPEHGRKHQIRRHFAGLGHPIVGDARYGGPGLRAIPGAPDRLWLHSSALVLPDGRLFEAPLPEELVEHLEQLRGLEATAG